MLAPVLLGQELSLLYYKSHCRPWDEISRQLWIGRKLNDKEAREALDKGVTAVLDLTAEFSEARPFLRVSYLNLQILDLTAPSPEQLRSALDFITHHSRTGVVYVHCKIGYSRSAGVVGAYLLQAGEALSTNEAVAKLRAARPSIVIRPEILQALQQFERTQVKAPA